MFTMRSDAWSEAPVTSPPLAQWAIATLPCDHERSIRTICDLEQCKPAAMHNSLVKQTHLRGAKNSCRIRCVRHTR